MMAPSTQGRSSPLGATVINGGVNFSLYSRGAQSVELLLFDHSESAVPSRVIMIEPSTQRTYHYWHAFVPEIGAGQIYAYRVHGTSDPAQGLRFDAEKALLDPYGRGVVVPKAYSRAAACFPGDNTAVAMKSVVVDPSDYDWEDDSPPRIPSARTIIYEMHLRGFTCHPNSGVTPARRGTYAGLIEKIPYLQRLGITAVELLPIFQFDPQDAPPGKVNYWGYSPVSFFAPHYDYCSCHGPLGAVNEFRDMVKALHRAGIEVILDVVFNHTAEGNENGPMLGFRGIDNPTYYILEEDRSKYANYSGCGNTFNANHPIAQRMIIDSLRYWVEEMHVDGFRFDLASILSRDVHGRPLQQPPVLWEIESDPALAGVKLFAEAWDAAGLYQVGNFVGDAWNEWNGRFRDDVRDFLRGKPGVVRTVTDRLVGSPEIFGHENRELEQSINFVTCHDGFTLNDLVSYDFKHNEANGEGNRDGDNNNFSENYGVEGPTRRSDVVAIRSRQVRNMLATLFLSQGVPMLVAGDECRRTQQGNNNAWCQDGPVSWFDWSLVDSQADLVRFARELIRFRLGNPTLRRRSFLQGGTSAAGVLPDVEWFSPEGVHIDWYAANGGLTCFFGAPAPEALLAGNDAAAGGIEGVPKHVLVMAHAGSASGTFHLPQTAAVRGLPWRLFVHTAQESPGDIFPDGSGPAIDPDRPLELPERSLVCLVAAAAPVAATSQTPRLEPEAVP